MNAVFGYDPAWSAEGRYLAFPLIDLFRNREIEADNFPTAQLTSFITAT
jgi:hypothetical protein